MVGAVPPDPFRVLEQIPLGLKRDDNMSLSPVRVDSKETPDGHIIMLDVLGLTKDDVHIQVEENRVLRGSGERKREDDNKDNHWHRVERSYGKFWRLFRLPENTELDSIKANLQNGCSTFTSPNCPLTRLRVQGSSALQLKMTNMPNPNLLNPDKSSDHINPSSASFLSFAFTPINFSFG